MVAPRDERDHQARHRKGRHDVGLTRLVWADAGAGPTKLEAIAQLPRCAKIRYDIPGDLKLVRSRLPESLRQRRYLPPEQTPAPRGQAD
jgi:hypothetical protein